MLLVAFTCSAFLAPYPLAAPQSGQPETGFTFSQQQTEYLDLPSQAAFVAAMGLAPKMVRLAVYWDKAEPLQGVYDFSTTDWLLAHVPSGTSVILVLGMKAPRWPEYYLPPWLQQANQLPQGARVSDDPRLQSAVLAFLRAATAHYAASTAIGYWQVENEPLDPAGPRQWTIGGSFYRQEIGVVRAADPQRRPVIASMFVPTNPVPDLPGLAGEMEAQARTLLAQADILGLDVYPARADQFAGFGAFVTWPAYVWQPQLRKLQRLASSYRRPVWVTEAQAEPWLLTHVVYLGKPPSTEIAPTETEFLVNQLRADGFGTILLWGVEYWYLRRDRFGDGGWWNHMRELLTMPASSSQP